MADVSEIIRALRERAEGTGAAIRTLGTGMAADVPAGLGGLASLAGDVGAGRKPSTQRAAERVRQLRERYTYEPTSEAGKEAVGAVGTAVEKAGEAALKLPGAKRAQSEWVDFTAQNPALAAGIVGIANVADPGKGAGRTAKRLAKLAPDAPIPTRAQAALPGMELTKQQQLGQALHNLDLLERDPNMRTSAPLEAGGRVMQHGTRPGPQGLPQEDFYTIRSPGEGEKPMGIAGNEYLPTSALETSRGNIPSGPLRISVGQETALPYEMGGTPVVLDQLRRYGLMEDANRALDRIDQLSSARASVHEARAGLARGERERIGEQVRALRGQEASPDLIEQEGRMREIAQLASTKPIVDESNAVYRWNPETGYEDVGGNRVSEARMRDTAPEQMALRDRAVQESIMARREANQLRSFLEDDPRYNPTPVTPEWTAQLPQGGHANLNPDPAGLEWWNRQLGVTDYKADPGAMNREAVAQFFEDVRTNPAAFQYGVEPPSNIRDLEGMAAHFGRQSGKKIDVDIEGGYGESDEPYKIKVPKEHGRGEVMRDRYGDYKQFQKEHERGDYPMYDEYGDVKMVETVGPPREGEEFAKKKRVAEGGEPLRDYRGDEKYGFKKSEGGEPVRDERGRQKYTEEENPDYDSGGEQEEAKLRVRGEGGALTVTYPESGEASMGATAVGKSEKSPGALLYQTVLADAVRRGIDIGSFGLTSDNQLRLLSNTVSNYARMGENPRSVAGTLSGRAPAARGRAEGPELMRAEAGETRARIGDEKADRIAFDGENFTVDGQTVSADKILDAVGFKAGSRNVGQKGAMRMAFYEWLRGVDPETASKAAKGWGKHGAIFTSIVGAAGLGAAMSEKENANVD